MYRDGGQGAFEIRTYISVAAAAKGQGEVLFYHPISVFACGCPIGMMSIA
jgi:2,3-dihydroxyphenylpropionate 1,2-dioxygenase